MTDGGPSGTNSDLIGIDTFSIDRAVLATNEVGATSRTVSVYPNPTTDYLTVKSEEKISTVEIYDISGKKIPVSVEGNTIDVKKLNAGTYLINIETKTGKVSEKFIKK